MDELKKYIREVPDFPKKGILYYDITTLLQDPLALRMTVDQFVWLFSGQHVDKVVGIESRGFMFGSIVAYNASFERRILQVDEALPLLCVPLDSQRTGDEALHQEAVRRLHVRLEQELAPRREPISLAQVTGLPGAPPVAGCWALP